MGLRENIGGRVTASQASLQALGVNSVDDFIHRCLTDLFYLCAVVLRHGKSVEYRDLNHIHRLFCDFLDFTRNPYPQKLALMSRDTLKSTIGRGLMIQEFLKASVFNEEKLFGVYTGLTKLSEEHLTRITREILTNELIQGYFHGYVPSRESEADAWGKEGVRYGKIGIDIGSLKKSLTGFHYGGVWSDNIVNEQNVRTADLRWGTFDTWQRMESIVAQDAWELVTETPWEKDDLSGRILDPDCDFDYKKIKGKSPGRFMSTTGYDVFSCFVRNEKGELNFLPRLDESYLERKRRKQGEYFYMRMYEGQVIDAKDIQIQPAMNLKYDVLPDIHIRFISVDCAGTRSDRSSDSAVTVGDWGLDRNLYIPYSVKKKVRPIELFNWVVEIWDQSEKEERPAWCLLIEREKYGIFLESLLEERRPDIHVLTVSHKGLPKPERHVQVVPYFEAGRILSRKGLRDYDGEIKSWYKGKKEGVDIFDTLWMLIDQRMYPRKPPVANLPAGYRAAKEPDDDFLKQIKRDREGRRPDNRQLAGMF